MIKRIAWGSFGLLVLILLVLALLLFTQSGARLAFSVIESLSGGNLRVTSVQGRLLGTLTLQDAHFESQSGFAADLDKASLKWHPSGLLRGQVLVDRLELDELSLNLPKSNDQTKTAWPPGIPVLPVGIIIQQAQVNGLTLHQASGSTTRLDSISLSGSANSKSLKISNLGISGEGVTADLSGEMQLRGNYPLNAKLDWRAKLPEQPEIVGGGTVKGDLAQLEISQQLQQPQKLDVNAKVKPGGKQLQAELTAQWQALQWPLSGTPQWQATGGKLLFKGSPTDYAVTLNTGLKGAELPATQADIEGQGNTDSLNVQRLKLGLLSGKITGNGRLNWADKPAFTLNLRGADLNPGIQWPDWEGKLAFDAATRGEKTGGNWNITANISQLVGMTHGKSVDGQADVQLNGKTLKIPQLALNVGHSHISAKGEIDQQLKLQAELDSPDMGDWLPGAQGQAKASLKFNGPTEKPLIKGTVEANALAYEDKDIGRLNLDLDLDLGGKSASHIHLKATDLAIAERSWDTLTLDADGPLSKHSLQAKLSGPEESLDLAANGGFIGDLSKPDWRGELTQLNIQSKALGQWSLQQAVKVQASPKSASLQTLCLGTEKNASLCADGGWQAASGWNAQAKIQNLPLSDLPLQLPKDSELNGVINAKLDARQDADDLTATLEVTPFSGYLQVHPPGKPVSRIAYRNASVQAGLSQQQLKTNIGLQLDDPAGEEKFLRGNIGLQPIAPGQPLEEAKLNGRIQATLDPAQLLAPWLPEMSSAQGNLDVDVQLSGSAGQPLIRGHAGLAETDIALTPVGVNLKSLKLDLQGGADGRIQITGEAQSGDGSLKLTGEVTPDTERGWPFTATLQGRNFLAADTPEIVFLVSPDVKINYQDRVFDIRGNVDIPRARFTLPELPPGAISVSSDVIVVDDRPSEQTAGQAIQHRVTADINLSIGDAQTKLAPACTDLSRDPLPQDCPGLLFDGHGLRTLLAGNLRMTDSLKQDLQADGLLRVLSGVFSAYGQQIPISEGRLIFSGSPYAPSIYALAQREVGSVTAGLKLTGSPSNLNASLYSTPAMSQMQALSYLLLGKPLDSASGDQSNLLSSAAMALGNKLLANPTGLSITSDGTDAEGNPDLAIGKYLSSRLYLGYGVDLYDHSAGVKIVYQLSQRLTLRLQGGESGSADLAYAIEWD